MKRIILALLVGSMVSGCAASLPMKVSVDRDYNTRGVRTASVNMDCENIKTDDIDPASLPDFCNMLHASAKASIRKKAGFAIVEGPADLDITIKLEEMYGGNAAARFFVGLGAGRSVITSYITIMRDGKDIAEGRLVETSTMPNITGNAWSNDQIIMQDIGIIGGKIADFVANPRDFDSRPDQVQPLYR